jgi:hypothetical protein
VRGTWDQGVEMAVCEPELESGGDVEVRGYVVLELIGEEEQFAWFGRCGGGFGGRGLGDAGEEGLAVA